jgi:hypothetical protein
VSVNLHPSLGSRHMVLEYTADEDCTAELTVDVDVSLLKPGLRAANGGMVMTAEP